MFNADRIAQLETDGWKAYEDRNWVQLPRLMLALFHEQFHIPFPLSLLAAYYVTRASVDWVPADHDVAKVQANLEHFYRLARRYSGLSFDPARAARLETQYWADHRRLVGNPDKTDFINTMIDLHAEVFGITREQARESGELRVEANNILDDITRKLSTNTEADWARILDCLRRCYRSIAAVAR